MKVKNLTEIKLFTPELIKNKQLSTCLFKKQSVKI